jgi:hypothetical protein
MATRRSVPLPSRDADVCAERIGAIPSVVVAVLAAALGACQGAVGTPPPSDGATLSPGDDAASPGADAGRFDARPPPPPRDGGPMLSPGVWVDLTPRDLDMNGTFGSPSFAIDPSHPQTIYLCVDQRGIWKTLDGGVTWRRLGNPAGTINIRMTTYLDSPFNIAVDPDDSMHLYATQGVRGASMGFWISRDGGETWTQPDGFSRTGEAVADGIQAHDVTSMDVDPADFRHVLISSHSAWRSLGGGSSGIYESTDGGTTWQTHSPPGAPWAPGTKAVHFLHNLERGLGDGSTWWVGDEGGFWRTTDAGRNWTRVSTAVITHGGGDLYYARDGAIYVGAMCHPHRSRDNGATWASLDEGNPYAYYYSVWGDGSRLYTHSSAPSPGTDGTDPFVTSPESDGATWSPQPGAQPFGNGPFMMRFDGVNRIMYSANWRVGFWGMRVIDP